MAKRRKIELRYYDMAEGTYLFGLLGKGWVREYGHDIANQHFHNFLEVGYCRFGEGHMEFDEDVRPYRAGDMTIIPRHYPHTTNSIPGTKSYWEYLFIDVDRFVYRFFTDHRQEAQELIHRINRRILFFHESEFPRLAGEFKEIMEILRVGKSHYMDEAEGLLKAAFVELIRKNEGEMSEAEKKPAVLPGKASGIIVNALEYVGNHYQEEIRVGDLAEACYISETHLRRIFQEHVRMGVAEYINLVRVNKACERMRKTDESIADIAYHCGYTSLATFHRNFRQMVHMKPGEWRGLPENCEHKIRKASIHFEEGWKSNLDFEEGVFS